MTLIIAEIGINHNADMKIVKNLIDMAKDCGADMVKFQKRTIDIVYSQEEQEKPRESPWGTTNGDQKRGLELSYVDYCNINAYSKKIEMPWFASAWDIESLEFLDSFDLPYNKVASAMLTHCEFIEQVAMRKKHTFISTGLIPDLAPVRKAIGTFMHYDTPFTLMHCTGSYPCDPEDTNLAMIATLKGEFPWVQIGFSSHAVSPKIPEMAVCHGAEVIEVHITTDRSMYGSDQAASLEWKGLKDLVDFANLYEQAKGDGVKRITEKEIEVAKKLRYWEV